MRCTARLTAGSDAASIAEGHLRRERALCRTTYSRVVAGPMRRGGERASLFAMQITAAAERTIDAPAEHLYRLISDFRQHHPNFLPSQFSDFEIETGGMGAGTVHR